jgi:hypothetical protein
MNDASEVLLSIFSCLHEALHLQNPPTPSTQGDGLLPTPSNWPAPRNKAGTAFKVTDGMSGTQASLVALYCSITG